MYICFSTSINVTLAVSCIIVFTCLGLKFRTPSMILSLVANASVDTAPACDSTESIKEQNGERHSKKTNTQILHNPALYLLYRGIGLLSLKTYIGNRNLKKSERKLTTCANRKKHTHTHTQKNKNTFLYTAAHFP